MSMAKLVNQACIEAVSECPQFRGFFGTELVSGREVKVRKLHKKGIASVITYWTNKDTIGGEILWESSYYECLPPDVLEVFGRAESVIAAALEKEFGK